MAVVVSVQVKPWYREAVSELVRDTLPDVQVSFQPVTSTTAITITDDLTTVVATGVLLCYDRAGQLLVDDLTLLEAHLRLAAAAFEPLTAPPAVTAAVASSSVVLVGAFDRFNLGDVLLGQVFRDLFREAGLRVLMAGVAPADLRHRGGDLVYAFADLAPLLSPFTPIVHVGGETLGATTAAVAGMLVPLASSVNVAALFAACSYGLSRHRPYVTPPQETIRGQPYAWHRRYFYGVGGQRATIVPADLQGARFIGVRDTQTLKLLETTNVHATLVEDAVCRRDQPIMCSDESQMRYAVVHAADYHLKQDTQVLAEQVAAGLRAAGISRVVCLMVASAAHHDSVSRTSLLRDALLSQGLVVQLVPSPSVPQAVALVSAAAITISTSLHVRILAANHGVPRVSLCVPKVTTWAHDWDAAMPCDVPVAEVAEAIKAAMKQSSTAYPSTDRQMTTPADLVQRVCCQLAIDSELRDCQPASIDYCPDAAIACEPHYTYVPTDFLSRL